LADQLLHRAVAEARYYMEIYDFLVLEHFAIENIKITHCALQLERFDLIRKRDSRIMVTLYGGTAALQ